MAVDIFSSFFFWSNLSRSLSTVNGHISKDVRKNRTCRKDLSNTALYPIVQITPYRPLPYTCTCTSSRCSRYQRGTIAACVVLTYSTFTGFSLLDVACRYVLPCMSTIAYSLNPGTIWCLFMTVRIFFS